MKVQGPSGTQKSSESKKSSKSSSASGAKFGSFMDAGDAGEVRTTTATNSINSVDSLLAIQASEDPTARAAKSRMRDRAHSILDKLENLKMSMLVGNVTVGELLGIADVVAAHREKIDDPHLIAILDEVDLRAQIEIAKMTVAMKNKA